MRIGLHLLEGVEDCRRDNQPDHASRHLPMVVPSPSSKKRAALSLLPSCRYGLAISS